MKTPSAFISIFVDLLRLLTVLALLFGHNGIQPVSARSFSVGNAAALIDAINMANSNAADDTITLLSDISLSLINNTTNGSNGLPMILSDGGHALVIEGNGYTLSRSTADGIPEFRIIYIAAEADLTLNQLTVAHGANNNGGGILNDGGAVKLMNSTMSNNAAIYGGGIYNYSGNLTLTNSTLNGNAADLYGGGIDNGGTLTIENSTLSGNTADGGGGIRNYGGTVTIENSTLSGNSANNGGGVYNFLGGTVVIEYSTLSDNTATLDGGGIDNFSGSLTLNSSLVSGNSASGAGVEISNFSGTVTSGHHNLFGHSSLSDAQAFERFTPSGMDITATSDGSRATTLTSILNPILADHGGPTLTHALVAGSPAIDAAEITCQSSDQRGVTRPQGPACDIGAFEDIDFVKPTVTINQAAGQSDPTSSGPIHFTVIFSEPISTTSFITTDITLGGSAPGTLLMAITEVVPNDGTSFVIAIDSMSGSGTVTATLAADMIQDLNSNGNVASTSTDNEVTYQFTPGDSFQINLPLVHR